MNTIVKLIELKEAKQTQKEEEEDLVEIFNKNIIAMGKALSQHRDKLLLDSITSFVPTDVSDMFRNCTNLHQNYSQLINRENIKLETVERI